MSFNGMLCLVLAAVYACSCLLLSMGVALLWHAVLERRRLGARELLTLRLAPAAVAALLTLTVALPAFVIHEPHQRAEPVGPLLVLLAVVALGAVGSGMLRGLRAWRATRALLRRGPEPLAAVVGAWRPRILAAACVREVLSDEEFAQVIAHETAHVTARDNVKLLLQIMSPDALTWMPAGKALTNRWRAAAELEADARAGGLDTAKRLALASALLKVARLSAATGHRSLALRMSAFDDVADRVRELLAPLPMPNGRRLIPQGRLPWRTLMACSLLIAVIGVPFYGGVHTCIEALVAFGSLSE